MSGYVHVGRIARVVVFILALAISTLNGTSVFAFDGTGAGTSGNPYQITTCAQLNSIDLDLDAYYTLANDIDCSGAGASWSPIGASGGFTGTLDGQNYKVANLDLSDISNSTNFVGIFSAIKNTAVVKNLSIINGKVNGGSNTGMMAGALYNTATLDNVYVQATVNCHGDNCGGLVGSQRDSSIINDSGADVTVTSDTISAGGLVGWISGVGTIQESFANGYIAGTLYVGGLVGAVNNGGTPATITNAYANTTVVGSEYVGGVAGMAIRLNLTNAYAVGSVSGTDNVGGLVGIFYGHMAETFAANAITGTGGAVGPVTGHFAGGTVGNRYFDTNISGFNTSPDGSSPITNTNYFKDNSANPPFDQWNFSTMWRTNYANYPSFAPKVDPYMLCEEPHSTDESIAANCEVAPLGWGTPTWQARWSVHGADDWHTIALDDVHKASVTVTGLQPGTQYDISFRYTNDFGTGPWGTVQILTTGQAPVAPSPAEAVSVPLHNLLAMVAGFYAVPTDNVASSDAVLPASQSMTSESANHAGASAQTTSDVGQVSDKRGSYGWVVISIGSAIAVLAVWLYIMRHKRQRQE